MRGSRERGASAIEFALIVPVLILLLFAIIDFGLWFSDSINVRQGVRDAARAGVVGQFGTDECGLSGGSQDMRQLACSATKRIGSVSGPVAVQVVPPASWKIGQPLLVCGMVAANGVTGLTPLPKGGLIKSKVAMSVEVADAGQVESTVSMTPLNGSDWSWCTP